MLLVDMEMPKSCSDCPICYDFICCPIIPEHMDFERMNIERLPNCPLKELDTKDIQKHHIVPTVDCRDCKLFDNMEYCQYAGECTTLIAGCSDFRCKYFKRRTEDGN